MNIKRRIERLIDRHGDDIVIIGDNGENFRRAFIRPILYRNKMYADNSHSSLGEIDQSCFLYIGPYIKGMETRYGSIEMGTDRYVVARVDKILYRSEFLFVRAILRKLVIGGMTN